MDLDRDVRLNIKVSNATALRFVVAEQPISRAGFGLDEADGQDLTRAGRSRGSDAAPVDAWTRYRLVYGASAPYNRQAPEAVGVRSTHEVCVSHSGRSGEGWPTVADA